MNIGLLCSGRLGYETITKLARDHKPLFILTDKKSIDIITFATKKDIPYYSGNPRKGAGYDFIKSISVDIIISVNYLFLIQEDIIKHPKYCFNVHGSLLPKYRGRTPHVWAIINGETRTGMTAHLIDSGCDTGDIIKQIEIPIESDETGADILSKYKDLYYSLIKEVMFDIENNTFKSYKQDHSIATYYGKRTPESGLIDWNWQKERIKNWVRAQSYPYPGAYSFIDGIKIVIDKIDFSDRGFSFDMPNGLVLESDPDIIVKTPNGAIRLIDIRENKEKCKQGNIFNS